MDKTRLSVAVLAVALAFSVGCKGTKDTALKGGAPPVAAKGVETDNRIVSDPPRLAPPTTGAPRVDSFTAEPARVERGSTITLRWATANADTVTIDQGVGN